MPVGKSLSSTRPYLMRAMHEWMTDNGQTPLVVVDTTCADVDVPTEHIKDGRIVLNAAWSATRNLQMGNDDVSFEARFSGVSRFVSFPVNALRGIYARETGQGMQFEEEAVLPEATLPDTDNDEGPDDRPERPKGPNLRVVK
jgi:stringent starvation protein B